MQTESAKEEQQNKVLQTPKKGKKPIGFSHRLRSDRKEKSSKKEIHCGGVSSADEKRGGKRAKERSALRSFPQGESHLSFPLSLGVLKYGKL
ncbi:MAG: hypothetical protein EOL93_09470 [Epsilonproteobacteria bacterium]|nr:hypothetical protein [Campylobacterota bacterium]